jgi:hypothetical protein
MALVNIASSSTTANVIEGNIMSQLVGAWIADLRIDDPTSSGGSSSFPAGTQVTITSENGYSRTGVVDPTRTGSRLDAVHVRVIGGAGGMFKASSARSFVQPSAFVRDVINGLVADSGETLDSTTSQTFLTQNLTAWSTLGGNSVARNLKALLSIAAPGYNWRILANGNLWIGQETWSASTATFDVMDFDPADQSYLIASESPFIVPGVNIASVGNVARVLDIIEDGHLRTRCYVDIPGTVRGLADATQRMALQALPGVDYYALYICQVAAQNGNNVDLNPVGARNKALLGSLQRVPLRVTTGVVPTMAPGGTVLLGWDGGNPEVPYCIGGFAGDTATNLALSAQNKLSTSSVTLSLSATGQATLGGATTNIQGNNTTQIAANGTTLTLGTNPVTTPVVTMGAIDGMGIPITNCPTNTMTVLSG